MRHCHDLTSRDPAHLYPWVDFVCVFRTSYVLLHFVLKFHHEISKAKEMTTFLYVFSDHPM